MRVTGREREECEMRLNRQAVRGQVFGEEKERFILEMLRELLKNFEQKSDLGT